jgi:hypothetical protein
MSNTATPTQKQLKPFTDLVAALGRAGFSVEQGHEGMDCWAACRLPHEASGPIDTADDKQLGQHVLHFSFNCACRTITSYAITRDVWERTDEVNVASVEAFPTQIT